MTKHGNMAYGPNLPPRIAKAIRALIPQPSAPAGDASARSPRIEFHQHDWLPGFAAFLDDGKKLTKNPESKAFCVLNLGAFLAAVETGDLKPSELAEHIADSMTHEVLHVIEKWAGTEFSEDRVEALLTKYRAGSTQGGEAR